MTLCLFSKGKPTKLRKGDKITFSRMGHIEGDMHSFVMIFSRKGQEIAIREEYGGGLKCGGGITYSTSLVIELHRDRIAKFVSLLAVSCGLSFSQKELIRGEEYVFTLKAPG